MPGHPLRKIPPVLGVRHDGLVGGDVQREHPGPVLGGRFLMPLALGRLGCQFQGSRGQAIHVRLLCEKLLEGLGGVHHIVGELGAQLRKLLLDLVEALFRLPLRVQTCQAGAAPMLLRFAVRPVQRNCRVAGDAGGKEPIWQGSYTAESFVLCAT
jgi:hypothetical protein